MKNDKISSILIAAAFCAMIGVFFLLSLLLPKTVFSDTENRYLAQKPDFRLDTLADGSFGRQYEEYLSDQFPFRDGWIRMKTAAELAQFKREIGGVFVGKDGFLMNALYPEDIDRTLLEKNLDALAAFAKAASGSLGEEHVRILLAPSASQIFTDRLPSSAAPFDESTVTDDLLSRLPDGTLLVSVKDAFIQAYAEKSGKELYYKTDHHWTSYGAYKAYQAWAASMGLLPYRPEDFEVQTVDTDFFGTIHSRLNLAASPDSIELYLPKNAQEYEVFYDGSTEPSHSLYSPEALKTKDKYRVFLDGNHGLTKIVNRTAPEGRRLLIIKDSYAHSFAPFASLHFEEVYMVDLRYYNGKISDFMEEQAITDALVLYQIPGFLAEETAVRIAR